MKKKLALILGTVLCLATTFAACGSGGDTKAAVPDDKTWLIKVADGFPANHVYTTNALKPFMNSVEAATDGRVTFEHYPAGQLGKQADMLDLLKTGVADMAIVGPAYMSGVLPLSSAFELPAMYPDGLVASMAVLNLCRDGVLYDEEFSKQGVRPIIGIAYSPYNIFNNKKAITKVGDMKGMTVRGSGLSMEMAVSALGGSLVNIVPQEMYEAAMRGTVDALALSMESLDSYKVQEVVKYGTTGMNITGWIGVYCFSDKVWNSFPEDIQKIILEEGEKASINSGNFIKNSSAEFQKQFTAEGVIFNELSDAAKTEFKEALAGVETQWVKEVESRGYSNAEEILAEVKAEIAEQDELLNKK